MIQAFFMILLFAVAAGVSSGLLVLRDRFQRKNGVSLKERVWLENRSVAAGMSFVYFILILGCMINLGSPKETSSRGPYLIALVGFAWMAISSFRSYIRLRRKK